MATPHNTEVGDVLRHKDAGTEVVVVEPDTTTFEENGYEVKTKDDGVHRFLKNSELEDWEHVEEEGIELSDDEASVLYWALERLDVEEGLNDDEKPVFNKLAEHVGNPSGVE